MSLIQGKECSALSFSVTLDEIGAAQDYSIHISTIKPTYRLTYDDVDEMLELGIEAEPEIAAIASAAKLRQKWREAQGAISIFMPESVIKVNGDDIKIHVIDDSTARMLVAEMMILAGELAARYGQAHSLPIPYRYQAQPELPPDEELLAVPAGPARACAVRRLYAPQRNGPHPRTPRRLGFGIIHSSYFPDPSLYRLAGSLPNQSPPAGRTPTFYGPRNTGHCDVSRHRS
jgi:exoribonuclease-2